MAAAYVQDQLELSARLQLLGGLRFDRFDLTYHNNRNGDTLDRVDDLLSPRAGIVYKPIVPAVPLRQLHRLVPPELRGPVLLAHHASREQVEPEQFTNYEVGAKWEPRSRLAVTAALYRLDRTNTRATDPNDPTRIVQTGSQRTTGFEVGVTGRVSSFWQVAGGYAHQDATVTSATDGRAGGRPGGPGAPPHPVALEQRPGAAPLQRGRGRSLPQRHVRHHRQHGDPSRVHAGRPRGVLRVDEGPARAGQPRERLRRDVLDQRGQQHEPLAGLRPRPARRGHGGVLFTTRGSRRSLAMPEAWPATLSGAPANRGPSGPGSPRPRRWSGGSREGHRRASPTRGRRRRAAGTPGARSCRTPRSAGREPP